MGWAQKHVAHRSEEINDSVAILTGHVYHAKGIDYFPTVLFLEYFMNN
jgi:hypothetical protein